jgi:hypothetical protein
MCVISWLPEILSASVKDSSLGNELISKVCCKKLEFSISISTSTTSTRHILTPYSILCFLYNNVNTFRFLDIRNTQKNLENKTKTSLLLHISNNILQACFTVGQKTKNCVRPPVVLGPGVA